MVLGYSQRFLARFLISVIFKNPFFVIRCLYIGLLLAPSTFACHLVP